MRIAIHQPNFLPHAGFFAKMLAADGFVLLDTAQYTKDSFINRTMLLSNGEAAWATVPAIASGHSHAPIREIEIAGKQPWVQKLERRLRQDYSASEHVGELMDGLAPILEAAHPTLLALNKACIGWVRGLLGITAPMWLASELDRNAVEPGEGETDEPAPAAAVSAPAKPPAPGFRPKAGASKRLAELTVLAGGSHYLSGPSGRNYLTPDAFSRAGIEFEYFASRPAEYPQRGGAFVAGLSVLDMLMWRGAEETRRLLDGMIVRAAG